MKTKLLKKWYRQIEIDIKKNPYRAKIFSFRYNKDRIINIGNLPEKRLNVHIYAITMWNYSLLWMPRRIFERKYEKYSRKYWTPKAIMERNLRGIED